MKEWRQELYMSFLTKKNSAQDIRNESELGIELEITKSVTKLIRYQKTMINRTSNNHNSSIILRHKDSIS